MTTASDTSRGDVDQAKRLYCHGGLLRNARTIERLVG